MLCGPVCFPLFVSKGGDIVPGRNMFQVWGSGGCSLSLISADTQHGIM